MRRPWRVLAALVAATTLTGGCAAAAHSAGSLYAHGVISIGTGSTTGVFYTIGSAYAGTISTHLSGYEGQAVATLGSVDNLRRLDSHDIDVGFAFASNAADAFTGKNQFSGHPLAIRALARVHNNYTQVIVREDAHISTFADLRGHRVNTGTHSSGTEATAFRMLAVANIDPARDLVVSSVSFPEAVAEMATGAIDAMFWSTGLPAPGVTELFSKAKVFLMPIDSLLPALDQAYGQGVYTVGTIPKQTYGMPADVPTIVEPNLLVVRADMPEDLQYQLTRLLFEYPGELIAVNTAAKEITRATGSQTAPVTLAPGSARYFANG